MTDLLYTSLYIILIIASVQVLCKVTCGPGTQPRERSKGKVQCVVCPTGTFSKGGNSKCRKCRTCEAKPKKACTLRKDAVCKTDGDKTYKECRSYLRKNQTDLFLSRCGTSWHYIQRVYCFPSGKCNPDKDKSSNDTRTVTKKPAPPPEVSDAAAGEINLEEDEVKPHMVDSSAGINGELYIIVVAVAAAATLSISVTLALLTVCIRRRKGTAKSRDSWCIRMKIKHGVQESEAYPEFESAYYDTPESIANLYSHNQSSSNDIYEMRPMLPARCYLSSSLFSILPHRVEERDATSASESPPARGNPPYVSKTLSPRISLESPNYYENVGRGILVGDDEESQSVEEQVESTPLLAIQDESVHVDGYSTACTISRAGDSKRSTDPRPETETYPTTNGGLLEAEPIVQYQRECEYLPVERSNKPCPVLHLTSGVSADCVYDDCYVQGSIDDNCSYDDSDNYAASENQSNGYVTSDQYYAHTASDQSTYYISSQYDDTKPVTFKNIHNDHQRKDVNLRAAAAGYTLVSCVEGQGPPGSSSEDSAYDPCISGPVVQHVQEDTSGDTIHNPPSDFTPTSTNQPSVQNVSASVRPKDTSKQECRPENLHENLFKTEGTQTRQNCENLLTIFGQKFDQKKYFTNEGGIMGKSTTDITLTVFPDSVLEGETVLVGGRFTCRSLDILPYLPEGWVTISPLAEFEMTFRKRWDKHVKIHLPYYPHNPKEEMKVFYYHRGDDGEIQTGEVPILDKTSNQDMYYIKKDKHVEIYTMSFTVFHCACDKKIPCFMTSLVFMAYDKDENEAVVRLHVGDHLLGSKTFKQELKEKEGDENNTVLKKSADIRLLQPECDKDSRLIFNIVPKGRSSTAEGSSWENIYPQQYPQKQMRRFEELINCQGNMATGGTNITSGHPCHSEIEWRYKSTLAEPPDRFQCDLSITHELAAGQDTDRGGTCQEGFTFLASLKVSAVEENVVKSSGAPDYGFSELMSSRKQSFDNH